MQQPKKKNWIRLVELILGIGKIELSAFAASSAFFLFLSLIPILMLICSLIPFTGLSQSELVTMVHESIGQIAPGTVTALIEETIVSIFSGGAVPLSLSLLVTLWTASKAFLALMRGMDVIHGEGRHLYVVARLKSCFYTLVMVVVMAAMLVGVVFAKKIVYFIGGYVPFLVPLLRWILSIRYLVAWAVLIVFFTVIYTFVPKKKLRLFRQLPGAVFSATAWIAFSALFSVYLNYSSSFGIYGGLATIVIALFWMYFCMYILLLGTYLNVKKGN